MTAAKPGITLAEIKVALAERGIEGGHISTLWSTLRRLGRSHEKTRLHDMPVGITIGAHQRCT